MKDSILKYILIVSLLLNLSFLGTAAYTHYRQARFAPPFARMSGVPGPGPFGPGAPGGYLFKELSLRPEQIRLFQQKAVVFHQDLDKRREEIDALRTTLPALIGADKPDNKAIGETIARINKIQEEMQKTMVSHMIEFKSMLDKDQQKKFVELIGNAMGQPREAMCP